MSYYQDAPRAWGARGNTIDDNGNVVEGTSAVDTDLDRYASMTAPTYVNGPGIAHSKSDAARGIGLDALGMMEKRAAGGMTPAQALAAKQTQGAVNAGYSGAASIKGGAMARAAASRGAVAQGARVQALGNQDQAALAAREQAEAAGQLNAASTAMRGNDIGYATEQAKLNAGQRTANEGRDQFYENMGYNTQKARTDQLLGRSAADEAASNASHVQGINEAAAGRQQVNQIGSTIVGGATGALNGYAAGQTPAPQPQPQPRPGLSTRDDPYTTSDMRSKDDVEPMGYQSRSVMTSDAHAKQEAYALGRAHQWEQGKSGKPVDWAYERPEDITERGEMTGDRGHVKPPSGGRAASSSVPRKDAQAQRSEIAARDSSLDMGRALTVGGAALGPYMPAVAPGAAIGAAAGSYAANHDPMPATTDVAPPAAPAQPPAYTPSLSDYAGRMRAMISDERSKNADHGEDMAAANRSMAPFSYVYKPGFAEEAGQREGERNVGPMAQNMAANSVAKTAVVERPDGMLAIDKDKALKLAMGGLADLQNQVDSLKKKRTA